MHAPRVHGLLQASMLLSLLEGPKHGYDILRILEADLPPDMIPDRAVIYRILRELENGGYTTYSLEPGHGGPARKVYSLSAAGKELLREWREIIVGRAEIMKAFLDRFDRLGEEVEE